jgi:hypothetical protein
MFSTDDLIDFGLCAALTVAGLVAMAWLSTAIVTLGAGSTWATLLNAARTAFANRPSP